MQDWALKRYAPLIEIASPPGVGADYQESCRSAMGLVERYLAEEGAKSIIVRFAVGRDLPSSVTLAMAGDN